MFGLLKKKKEEKKQQATIDAENEGDAWKGGAGGGSDALATDKDRPRTRERVVRRIFRRRGREQRQSDAAAENVTLMLRYLEAFRNAR